MRSAEARTTATRLGSYEILHKLATGGMAELFLARSVGPENFEKLVVLKKILPGLAENEKFVQLFLDEARLVAGLDHPHIAHVYDLGRVDGSYFFTMEHVYGRDIRAVLHRSLRTATPWPIEHAVHVARTTLAALHYAHERCGPNGQSLGLVHRDVSPSNIMISYEGVVKLLDFGVAKVATSSTKTRTGSLKGKVSYMSPEQAKGAAIDRRSDIFSLGIVLWEMLAMQRLFKADNDLATLQLIINKTPDAPSTVRKDCPAELDRIVLRALSQDPAVRYQTAQAMQLEIEELAREARLNQSSIALGEQMSTLFAQEIETWKRAQAQGVTLEAHIVASAANVDLSGPGEFVDEPSELGGVEDDDEKTQRTEPPKAAAEAPPPEPAPEPPPEPPKKKKKRVRDYAIANEPSIVIEPALEVEPPRPAVELQPAPQRAPTPVPARAGSRPSVRAIGVRPRSVAQRRGGNTLLFLLAGVVLAGAGVVAIFLLRSNEVPAASSEPVAPAKIEIPLATPPPAPEPTSPPPVPEPPAAPASPTPPPKATPRPARHHAAPRPVEKTAPKPAAAPKYDPNAALPPM